MCMACEEEFMFQAYLAYLARKAAPGGEGVTAEEKAFLAASGISFDAPEQASGFSCEAVPEGEAAAPANAFSRMGPKAS